MHPKTAGKNMARPLLAALAALGLAGAALAASPQIKGIEAPHRVLFIGNSFTYYNDSLHNHLGSLLRAGGQYEQGRSRLRAATISGGRMREQAGAVRVLVTPGTWDAVVLQGHSTAFRSRKTAREFAESAAVYVRHMRKHGVQPVLFMTWAYENEPSMLRNLVDGYTRVGNRLDALVVPVGLAFARARQQHPWIDLYSPDIRGFHQGEDGRVTPLLRKDIKHPSAAGTYLAACVFYAALYGASPVGSPYRAGLPPPHAQALQQVAQETVQRFYGR